MIIIINNNSSRIESNSSNNNSDTDKKLFIFFGNYSILAIQYTPLIEGADETKTFRGSFTNFMSYTSRLSICGNRNSKEN